MSCLRKHIRRNPCNRSRHKFTVKHKKFGRCPHVSAVIGNVYRNITYYFYISFICIFFKSEPLRVKLVLAELVKKNIDGLIIEPSKTQIAYKNRGVFSMLDRYNIPYVFVQGVYHGMEDVPYVILDDEKGGYQITKHLIELGHTRIAGIFKADDRQGLMRHNGYVRALKEAGIWYDPSLIIWFHTEDARALPIESIVEQVEQEKVDSIVCYNDMTAMTVINALEEKGYRVPDDVSVTGFDDSDFASNFKVPLTTMRHPQRGLGETAAELLVKLMKGEKLEDDRMHMVMESELIVRESTKRR